MLSISEWSNAVKMSVAGLVTVGTIIGLYLSVDAWADEKISAAELRMIQRDAEAQARNEIDHDKMVQSTRISQSETNITITEMKLEELEDEIDERVEEGKDPTARQERSMERLSALLETYEKEQMDATTKLTVITQTTTTTTTTTENRP
jgi:hypothetical protein